MGLDVFELLEVREEASVGRAVKLFDLLLLYLGQNVRVGWRFFFCLALPFRLFAIFLVLLAFATFGAVGVFRIRPRTVILLIFFVLTIVFLAFLFCFGLVVASSHLFFHLFSQVRQMVLLGFHEVGEALLCTTLYLPVTLHRRCCRSCFVFNHIWNWRHVTALCAKLFLYFQQLLLKSVVLIAFTALEGGVEHAGEHLLIAFDFGWTDPALIKAMVQGCCVEGLHLVFREVVDFQVSLLIFLQPILERGQVVVDHFPIYYKVLFRFQVEHPGHGKIECESFHQPLKNMQSHFHKFYLIDEDTFLLRPV